MVLTIPTRRSRCLYKRCGCMNSILRSLHRVPSQWLPSTHCCFAWCSDTTIESDARVCMTSAKTVLHGATDVVDLFVTTLTCSSSLVWLPSTSVMRLTSAPSQGSASRSIVVSRGCSGRLVCCVRRCSRVLSCKDHPCHFYRCPWGT